MAGLTMQRGFPILMLLTTSLFRLGGTSEDLVGNDIVMKAFSLKASCVETLSLTDGDFKMKYLTSPNYPAYYGNNIDCAWIIQAPDGNSIHIEVSDLNLEAGFDFLQIYDGNFIQQAEIFANLSGNGAKNLEYITDSNVATVVFTSDASGSDSGFQIRYNLYPVTHACTSDPFVLYWPEGYVRTPNYPYNDAIHQCQWLIIVDESKVVEVTLELFFSTYDQLNITFYDGPSTSNEILQTSSHTELYTSFTATSTSNQMLVLISEPPEEMNIVYTFTFASVDFIDTTVCGSRSTVTSAPGIILSPSYPNYYAPRSNCQWLVQSPEGSHVMLIVDTFRVSNGDDIIFYDGATVNSPVIKRCTYLSCLYGVTISSTSNDMLIVFSSGSTSTDGYFKLKYYFSQGSGCDAFTYESDSNSGIATSPNYPKNYPNNYQCQYLINVSDGETIEFYFNEFSTATSDILSVYDGDNIGSPVIAQLSGNKKFYSGETTGSTMLMIFQTDSSVTKGGFMMTYSVPIPTTPTTYAYSYMILNEFQKETIVLSPNSPGFYPNDFDFIWYFDCRLDAYHIHFDFYRIDIDKTDFIRVYDGIGTDPANLMFTVPNFDDSRHPYANGEGATVWFHSSSSFNGSGFFMKYFVEDYF